MLKSLKILSLINETNPNIKIEIFEGERLFIKENLNLNLSELKYS